MVTSTHNTTTMKAAVARYKRGHFPVSLACMWCVRGPRWKMICPVIPFICRPGVRFVVPRRRWRATCRRYMPVPTIFTRMLSISGLDVVHTYVLECIAWMFLVCINYVVHVYDKINMLCQHLTRSDNSHTCRVQKMIIKLLRPVEGPGEMTILPRLWPAAST